MKILDYKKEILSLHLDKNLGSDRIAEELVKKYELKKSVSSLGRSIRKLLSAEGYGKPKETIEQSEQFKGAQQKKVNLKKKTYFITSAQNATPVNKKLLKSMKAYAEFRDAQIEVIALRYKNPTSVFTDKQKKDNYWSQEVTEYLVANRFTIGNRMTVLGDVKTQLTASMPLTSMEGLTRGESAIVGHPRMHFRTLPTLDAHKSKFLLTSGSITVPNYTDSKAGKRAEFNHVNGFTIIETDGEDRLHIRQVSSDKDGSFYDLDYFVDGKEVVYKPQGVKALVGGDIHVGETCPVTHKCTLGMLDRFTPNYYIAHDLMSGYSVNPHEKNDPFIALQREEDSSWDFRKELKQVKKYVKEVLTHVPKMVIVKSNHDDFIDRFIINADWRKEQNKKTYLKYANLKAKNKLPNGILPYEMEKEFGDSVLALTDSCSFIVADNELANHGHLGISGSRGSSMQYKRLNIKTITGHSHSPLLEDGNLTVGTQTYLKLNYTKGMGRWANANAIVHENTKRQLLIIEDGEYTNFK